ncbi:uncharacterized protein LOC116342078 [Contarinia nasturtii]|uniref:uncharacterized protein LOC116342078 n=1 Tax=Contarinia nasturtii TaxID=265458 RepID=UPI0012D3A463|nr:uncharacterized protein LOC116342078 [Contarinia nasturtii]
MVEFKTIVFLYFLCFHIDMVLSCRGKNSVLDDFDITPSKPQPPRPTAIPTIKKRTQQQCEEYKTALLASLPSMARNEDPNFVMTGQICSDGLGSLYEAKSDGKMAVYEVCFNDKTSSAIYTIHTLDMRADDEKMKHNSFLVRYTFCGSKVNDYYNSNSQSNIFDGIFGNGVITNSDIKLTQYFSRNHLVPHADFPSAEFKKLTYYFHNSFPGYQSINVKNWRKLEGYVRDIARDMNMILEVVTGIYKIMKKKSKSGNMMDIYLDMGDGENKDRRRFAVPAEAYKLVVDKKTNASLAFITSFDRNLSASGVTNFSKICNVNCQDLGYNFDSDSNAGYTICCTYDELQKYIKLRLPVKLMKTSILRNTNQRRSSSPPKKAQSPENLRGKKESSPRKRRSP